MQMKNDRLLNQNEFHEQTRYKLVWNLCLLFILLLSTIGVINYVNTNYNPIPDFFAVGVALTSFIVLIKTKNYKLVGYFASFCIFLIITISFFGMNALHYTTPGWMIVNIVFTYFILDKMWGFIALIAHFTVLFIYIFTSFGKNVVAANDFETADLWVFVSEYAIIGLALGYTLHLFMRTTNYSETTLTSNNALLIEQNNLIRKQNEEMEVMLKEIHHRVKNNLQIITSLLRLQAEKNSPGYQSVFDEAINRVNAMAIIHEKIYQSEMLSNFDLERYLVSLSESLLSSYSIDRKIEVKLSVKMTSIYSKSIVPLALLFNELFSNTIKHAFDEIEHPEIRVMIQTDGEGTFQMIYADNGKWKEKDHDSFGVELIEAMTLQLDGTMTRINSEKGTEYTFELVNLV